MTQSETVYYYNTLFRIASKCGRVNLRVVVSWAGNLALLVIITGQGVKFAGDEVVLADELGVVDDVQLFAGGQLFAADAADEAREMVDGPTSAPHQVLRRYALSAASTLGAEASVGRPHAARQQNQNANTQCNGISLRETTMPGSGASIHR